jgi:arsenate reductase
MANTLYNVLFICTGNSARSIMAEAMLNHIGRGAFRAFSAGTRPRGAVHPMTLEVLAERNYDTHGLRSKSWTEFAVPGAAPMDFIFTVCNQAAGESCPAWPGQPITAHWDFADPAGVVGGPEVRRRGIPRRSASDRGAHSTLREPADRQTRSIVAAGGTAGARHRSFEYGMKSGIDVYTI